MLSSLKNLFNSNNKKSEVNSRFIFVIGSGRSGTHFLGRIFQNNPSVELLLEDPKYFSLVKDINIKQKKDLLPKLTKRYKKLSYSSDKPYLLEKSHPNIWSVDYLTKEFPDAFFIGINRNVYQVVYSMLNHKGVLNWYNTLPNNVENPFLGITDENKKEFSNLPIESKCTLRWYAHIKESYELKKKYPEKVIIINYNDLCNNYFEEVEKLESIFNVKLREFSEKPNNVSGDKFKKLDSEKIANIQNVLKTLDLVGFEKSLTEFNK
ncbi:sulfotransferase family protein [Marivirga sp.]|uniref:sulfotransferase family protein n=1 Tax=Marivirga sp. TaxID=2018662 RepID=UPI003DA73D60